MASGGSLTDQLGNRISSLNIWKQNHSTPIPHQPPLCSQHTKTLSQAILSSSPRGFAANLSDIPRFHPCFLISPFRVLLACCSMMNFFHIFSSKTKRRSRESSPEQNPLTSPLLYREKEHALRKFSFSELENATNNFNRSQWIRDGQLGRVYKGSIKPPGGQGAPLVVEITKLHNIHSMQVSPLTLNFS